MKRGVGNIIILIFAFMFLFLSVSAASTSSETYATDVVEASGGDNISSSNYFTHVMTGTISGNISSVSYQNYLGFFFGAAGITNHAPTTPLPSLVSVDSSNESDADLNCSAVITDSDGDVLNITVRWFKDDILNFTVDYNSSYASGINFGAVLSSGNLSLGDVWICSVRLYDGELYSGWGNSSLLTIIDSTNPVLSIGKNDTEIEYIYESININWSATDNEGVDTIIFNVTFPNGTLLYESSLDIGEIDLGENNLTVLGIYNIYLWANDTSGNSDSASDSFEVVDTTPPFITIISPLNDTYDTLDIDFNVSLNEEGSWCSYSLDSAENITMTKLNDTYFWEQNISMTPGSHFAEFVCNDTNNNFNFTNVTFYISDEAAISIEFSDELHQTIKWSLVSLPVYNMSAEGNNDDGATDYYVNISAVNTKVDLYIKADGDLMTEDLDVLGLSNETFSYNTTDNTLAESINLTLTTNYFLIGNSLSDGAQVFLKFYLSAPSAQPAGVYYNSLEFKAVREGQSPL
ncbi:MAG: hypothetical protein ABH804_01860 [archaeon]